MPMRLRTAGAQKAQSSFVLAPRLCAQPRLSSVAPMVRFRSRGASTFVSPKFEAAPLDIDAPEFAQIATALGLEIAEVSNAAGHRVEDVYINDPELQRIYPLGLVPLGQRYFLDWLTTHGRADQHLTYA